MNTRRDVISSLLALPALALPAREVVYSKGQSWDDVLFVSAEMDLDCCFSKEEETYAADLITNRIREASGRDDIPIFFLRGIRLRVHTSQGEIAPSDSVVEEN